MTYEENMTKDMIVKYPNVKYQMIAKGITLAKMSNELGIHINTLKRKLSGETRWYFDEATKVSKILEKPASYLFESNN